MKRPKLNTNSFKKKRFWRWQFIVNKGGCKGWSKGIWENYCHRVCTFQFLSYKWWASTTLTIDRKSHKDIPSQIQTVSSILYSCCMDFDWIIRSINITLLVISQGNLSYVTADYVCTTNFRNYCKETFFHVVNILRMWLLEFRRLLENNCSARYQIRWLTCWKELVFV